MRFCVEEFSPALLEEMRPLWRLHHDEIEDTQMPYDPDLAGYQRMAEAGCLRIFSARLGREMVGYQVFVIVKDPHRQHLVSASQDILYLMPDYRKGMVAVHFLEWCDQQLIRGGVTKILRQMHYTKDLSRLFERMGYKLSDLTYARSVGGQ